jgi:hypothetical protein
VNDTRLNQVTALLDDARGLLVDLVDEGPSDRGSVKDFNNIDAARQFINSAITYVQAASTVVPIRPATTGGPNDAA